MTKWLLDNKEKLETYRKNYNVINKEIKSHYNKEYRALNPEYIKETTIL